VILCVVLAQVVLEGFAEEARQRSQLQLINGSNHSVAVFWLKTGTERVASLINLMLANRPDVRRAMIESGSRLCIIGWNEFTTDQPEFVRLARHPLREFAHNIHLRGLVNVDPTFDERLKKTYDTAMMAGLWKGKYASVNHHEYWAEGVQSWFDNNRENDHDHNHVNTREELVEYDAGLAELCREVFGNIELRYTKPQTRLTGHLTGYDPAKAPTFQWPQRLQLAQKMIRQQAAARSNAVAK
jgi:hypothetical protein